MNKKQIIHLVANESGETQAKTEEIINRFIDIVKHSVAAGHTLPIRGFGTFDRVTRKARTGRNIKTGAKVEIPARQSINFKPSKEFNNLAEFAKDKNQTI